MPLCLFASLIFASLPCLPLCHFATLPLCLFASLPGMRALWVCAPAHTGSAVLAKPLELGKDGIDSSSGDSSGVSTEGAGGIRVVFFLLLYCCAHVCVNTIPCFLNTRVPCELYVFYLRANNRQTRTCTRPERSGAPSRTSLPRIVCERTKLFSRNRHKKRDTPWRAERESRCLLSQEAVRGHPGVGREIAIADRPMKHVIGAKRVGFAS